MKTVNQTLIAYHGTTAGNFDEFQPRIRKGEQLGFGIHFAVDPLFAKLYALDALTARKGKAPTIYIAELTISSPLTANQIVTEGSKEFELAKKLAGRKFWTSKDEKGHECAWMQNAIDATSPSRASDIINEAGYDSVIYESRVGTQGVNARIIAKSLSFLVMKSDQISIISSIDLLSTPLTGSTIEKQNRDLESRIKMIKKAYKANKAVDNDESSLLNRRSKP